MTFTTKKTTVVSTKTVETKDGKTIEKIETVTSSTDGGDVDADEVEKAMNESQEAMSHVFDGFSERMNKVFEPFDRIFKKKADK